MRTGCQGLEPGPGAAHGLPASAPLRTPFVLLWMPGEPVHLPRDLPVQPSDCVPGHLCRITERPTGTKGQLPSAKGTDRLGGWKAGPPGKLRKEE